MPLRHTATRLRLRLAGGLAATRRHMTDREPLGVESMEHHQQRKSSAQSQIDKQSIRHSAMQLCMHHTCATGSTMRTTHTNHTSTHTHGTSRRKLER